MLTELLIILALIMANGLFAGAEIAIVSVRRTRVEELRATGSTSAEAVLQLQRQPERFLATVQIGITVVSATAAAFGGASLEERLVPWFEAIPILARYAQQLTLTVVVAGVSFASIVLGELVPKSLALRSAERYALLLGRPLVILSSLARPAVWLLTAVSNLLLKPFGDRTNFIEARHSAEELQLLVQEAARDGTVHPEAGVIASRALEFAELSAADVMVPRGRVVMLSRRANDLEIRTVLLEHPHTRIPIWEGREDNVCGYINAKDVLALAWGEKLIVLEDLLRPPYFAPELQPAVELLKDMRRQRVPMAIIVDEQGGMAGIVTFEDLVEELVGEIFSEHANADELYQREPDGAVRANGAAPIRDLNRNFGLVLPEDEGFSTIAGLCLAQTGRIPAAGEQIQLEGYRLEIVDASPRRVRTIRIVPVRAEESDPERSLG